MHEYRCSRRRPSQRSGVRVSAPERGGEPLAVCPRLAVSGLRPIPAVAATLESQVSKYSRPARGGPRGELDQVVTAGEQEPPAARLPVRVGAGTNELTQRDRRRVVPTRIPRRPTQRAAPKRKLATRQHGRRPVHRPPRLRRVRPIPACHHRPSRRPTRGGGQAANHKQHEHKTRPRDDPTRRCPCSRHAPQCKPPLILFAAPGPSRARTVSTGDRSSWFRRGGGVAGHCRRGSRNASVEDGLDRSRRQAITGGQCRSRLRPQGVNAPHPDRWRVSYR